MCRVSFNVSRKIKGKIQLRLKIEQCNCKSKGNQEKEELVIFSIKTNNFYFSQD